MTSKVSLVLIVTAREVRRRGKERKGLEEIRRSWRKI
jgi:hypothetical protein